MSELFERYQLSDLALGNRIVMAPMKRNRATVNGLTVPVMETYYRQRAGAGLIITEGTNLGLEAAGEPR